MTSCQIPLCWQLTGDKLQTTSLGTRSCGSGRKVERVGDSRLSTKAQQSRSRPCPLSVLSTAKSNSGQIVDCVPRRIRLCHQCVPALNVSSPHVLTSLFKQNHHKHMLFTVNPLMGTGNYNAISNNMKLVHWPLMGGLLRLVQR